MAFFVYFLSPRKESTPPEAKKGKWDEKPSGGVKPRPYALSTEGVYVTRSGRCGHRPLRKRRKHVRYLARADSAVRPYNRLPSVRPVFSLSFRGRKAPVGIRIPAPAGAESLPPSAREVGSAGGRDVDPPHPRCSSVGGDAHAVERSGTSTLGVHRPVCRGSAAVSSKRGVPRPGAGYFCPRRQKYPKTPFKPAV